MADASTYVASRTFVYAIPGFRFHKRPNMAPKAPYRPPLNLGGSEASTEAEFIVLNEYEVSLTEITP